MELGIEGRPFERTVLIIGAGAHCPYGFPSAAQLTEKIKPLGRAPRAPGEFGNSRTAHNYACTPEMIAKREICVLLRHSGILNFEEAMNEDMIRTSCYRVVEDFVNGFAQSQVESIDVYLAKILALNPTDELTASVGKLIIAFFIRESERVTPVGFHRPDWIQFLIQNYLRHAEYLKVFLESPPKIYTFNYDTHFERSFFSHLTSFHGYTNEDATKAVNGLKIKHIYGDVCSFNRPDKFLDTPEHYREAIRAIRVIGEERDKHDPELEPFGDDVESSDRTYFLGFSFDPLNVARLFSKVGHRTFRSDQFYCTRVGMTERQVDEIKGRIKIPLNFPSEKVDCLKLLSEEMPIFKLHIPEVLITSSEDFSVDVPPHLR